MFLELGRSLEKSWTTVIYSDNYNFFDKNCVQVISKNSNKRLMSQKKAPSFIDDIKKFKLYGPDIFGAQVKEDPALWDNTLKIEAKDEPFIDESNHSTASASNYSGDNDLNNQDNHQKLFSSQNLSSEK